MKSVHEQYCLPTTYSDSPGILPFWTNYIVRVAPMLFWPRQTTVSVVKSRCDVTPDRAHDPTTLDSRSYNDFNDGQCIRVHRVSRRQDKPGRLHDHRSSHAHINRLFLHDIDKPV